MGSLFPPKTLNYRSCLNYVVYLCDQLSIDQAPSTSDAGKGITSEVLMELAADRISTMKSPMFVSCMKGKEDSREWIARNLAPQSLTCRSPVPFYGHWPGCERVKHDKADGSSLPRQTLGCQWIFYWTLYR